MNSDNSDNSDSMEIRNGYRENDIKCGKINGKSKTKNATVLTNTLITTKHNCHYAIDRHNPSATKMQEGSFHELDENMCDHDNESHKNKELMGIVKNSNTTTIKSNSNDCHDNFEILNIDQVPKVSNGILDNHQTGSGISPQESFYRPIYNDGEKNSGKKGFWNHSIDKKHKRNNGYFKRMGKCILPFVISIMVLQGLLASTLFLLNIVVADVCMDPSQAII